MVDTAYSSHIRKELGKRITAFYLDLGLKRGEFARIVETELETLRSYERGRSAPQPSFFIKIREKYPATDIGYLLTGLRTILPGVNKSDSIPYRLLPVIDEVPPGGLSGDLPEEKVIDWMAVTNMTEENLFVLLIRDGAFTPEAREGDYAILAPAKDIENGKMYVVSTQASRDDLILRKIYKNDMGYRLLSSDKAQPTITVKANELKAVYKLVNIFRSF